MQSQKDIEVQTKLDNINAFAWSCNNFTNDKMTKLKIVLQAFYDEI